MSSYLARVEVVNGYSNIRPVMEMVDGGLIEVDEAKFGSYGTITIGALYGTESPFIQDQKYCVFTLTDAELSALEQTTSGYKIRAQDFLRKCKTIDSSAIREVVSLSEAFSSNNYADWGKETIAIFMQPITKSVYLSDNTLVFGPFTWEEVTAGQYRFIPSTAGEDSYIVNSYRKTDLNEPIYTFDAAKRTSDLLYGQVRHVIKIDKLPTPYGAIDCIDDAGLKEFVGRLLSQPAETKRAKREIREAVAALPTTQLTENRKQRILGLLKNGELADQTMGTIISDVFKSGDMSTIEPIVDKILGNANYSDKLLQIARGQEEYQKISATLERERASKEKEIKDLDIRIEQAKVQMQDSASVSSDEVEKLNLEVEELTARLTSYKQFDLAKSEYQETQRLNREEQERFKTLSKMNDDLVDEIKRKIQSAYSDLAIDGALSSLMLQEASKFERQNNLKRIATTVATVETVSDKATIATPSELIKFLQEELNAVNRTLTKNDVANIIVCLSQGFLTILAGDPGTGKTSLVSLIASILGLPNNRFPRYAEIAVEKGWTSRRDLIGYYNPLTKSFDAANKGLFSALATLNEESIRNVYDFPYLVLLDEANLSQMEHYWADFMSLCDFDKASRKISLSEDYEFQIPNTLRFIATINLDHTTEILSPRLIDRAWIIKLQASDLDIDDYVESKLDKHYPLVNYSVFGALCNPESWVSDKLDPAISDKFNRIRVLCQTNGIAFSPRVIGMIKKYCLACKGLMDDSDNSYVALDYAVAQKVLPMIDGYGENYQKFIDELLKECDQITMPRCYELLTSIHKKGANNMQYYQFFAR